MLRAGSIFYTIVITLIIAIITSSLILYNYQVGFYYQKLEQQKRLLSNTTSAINLLLSNQDFVEANQSIKYDLFNTGNDTVVISRKYWGAFELISASASFATDTTYLSALTGANMNKSDLYSIYVADNNKQLNFTGAPIINGPAHMPIKGVGRANIAGMYYTGGNKLLNGALLKSKQSLPKYNNNQLQEIVNGFNLNSYGQGNEVINIAGSLIKDSIISQFNKPTTVIINEGSFALSEIKLKGKIVLFSTGVVTVANDASIEDVIIFAPSIVVEQNFQGNFQGFATDSVIINKNVKLNYPSMIGLIQTNNSSTQSGIAIAKGTVIKGDVLAIKEPGLQNNIIGVRIDKGATLLGNLYTNGFVELSGTVGGSVTCNNTRLTVGKAIYDNYLATCKIDIGLLPENYISSNLLYINNTKGIAKWLN